MEESLNPVLPKDLGADGNSSDQMQETAWVAASQGGDTVAFNRLVLKWEKSIYNLALRMLQQPEEAAEAAQEIFISAFKSIRRFRRDSRFSTWLYRIAVNHCITRLRRRPPGVHYSLDDSRPDAWVSALPARESHEGELLREESRGRVRQALEYLSADQKAVVELKFFQELTFEQIADVVQAPLSTIKSRLYAGLETLKIRLGETSFQVRRGAR
jgi:RNA polymerase sigma-70 factor (ECF subfamily)